MKFISAGLHGKFLGALIQFDFVENPTDFSITIVGFWRGNHPNVDGMPNIVLCVYIVLSYRIESDPVSMRIALIQFDFVEKHNAGHKAYLYRQFYDLFTWIGIVTSRYTVRKVLLGIVQRTRSHALKSLLLCIGGELYL